MSTYCGFHVRWRGVIFAIFSIALIFFCTHLVRRPAPQELNGIVQFLRRRDRSAKWIRLTLSFPRNSDFYFPLHPNSVGLHLPDGRVFSRGDTFGGLW